MLTTTTKKVVALADFNALVVATYGKPYDFQQQDGCRDRGIHAFTAPVEFPEDYGDPFDYGISFAEWVKSEVPSCPYEAIDWVREVYPSLDMVVNDLHSRGLIEAGDYILLIDW